ncbi:MAG: hypothetical protein MJ247_01280 [Alphaproteobacteria bacterium]|nr:hypothetical protein [Alphaproteobacteria bacterium]
MEKENKLIAKQDTTDNKVVELKDEDLKDVVGGEINGLPTITITAQPSGLCDDSHNCSYP